jgi:phosphoribosylglycinamide formyltransferase-1
MVESFPVALGYVAGVRRLAVLASGSGSILQAMLDEGLEVQVVIADRPCGALARSVAANVPIELVERISFGPEFDRDAYTHEVVAALRRHEIELVAMAGFGTILTQEVHDVYPARIVNTHPALLPAFKGWHAVRDALAAGVEVTGCTVHLATLEVDDGPILAQEVVPVLPDDTIETLHERIKAVERRIYPRVLRDLMRGDER